MQALTIAAALKHLFCAPAAWWKRKNLRPPHLILWSLMWFGPFYLTRALFVAVVFCGWGYYEAQRIWRDTK